MKSMMFFSSPTLSGLLACLLLTACGGQPSHRAPASAAGTPAQPHSTPATPASTGTAVTAPAPTAAAPLEPAVPANGPPARKPGPPPVLHIAAAGDVMLGTDFPENWLPEDDGASLLAEVAPILQRPDITFVNFEGTLLDGGEPVKQCPNPKTCYLFRTPERYVKYLTQVGVDVVSLANNHARDFGEAGRGTTMQVLDAAGIRHSGLEGDVASWEVKGLRVALIAYAPFAYSHDFLDIPRARDQIRALKAEHDIVIVSMHVGAEGEEYTHITFNREVFHGENRGDSHAFAHAVIDAGADLVIGHGPHVVRALELYNDHLIAYSLGNFATYLGISVTGKKGYAPILLVDLDHQGRFIGGRIVSAIQQRPVGPVPDPTQRVVREMAELTRADFPDTPLRIAPDGTLTSLAQPPVATSGK